MILHLMIYDKFTKDYITRVNNLFDENEHLFIVVGNKIHEGIEDIEEKNVMHLCDYKKKIYKYWYLLTKMLYANKIILHSLFFSKRIIDLLNYLFPLIGRKYTWMIWGGDLYDAYNERNSDLIYEETRKKFIKNLPEVIVTPKEDYDFLCNHYETKAIMKRGVYSYNLPQYSIDEMEFLLKERKSYYNILLANSATKTCQYEDALDKLKDMDISNINIYCILSYPKDEIYISSVIKYGQSLFGESFIPILDFMSDIEYTSFLNEMDIIIFNHNRQQAFGNILKTLYLGKKIYINPINSGFSFFREIGCEVYSIQEINKKQIFEFDYHKAKKNKAAIEHYYSDDNFYKLWNDVFQ